MWNSGPKKKRRPVTDSLADIPDGGGEGGALSMTIS